MPRLVYQRNSVTGQRVLVGECLCSPVLVCGLCVQAMCPPETQQQATQAKRQARRSEQAGKRAKWSRRQERYARLLEGRQ